MLRPNITVVIPVYNTKEFFDQMLESLIKQSYREWKCIIVDDGSLDDSMIIANEYSRRDRRFELVNRSFYSNIKGANSCRNIGLEKAHTKLVMFVDSDDYLAVNCLDNRIKTIHSVPSYDFYIFKTTIVDNKSNIIGDFNNPDQNFEEIILRLIRHQIPWHTMSPVWQTKFLREIGGWNSEYERLQDVELNIRAVLHQPRIFFSASSFDSHYRLNEMTNEKKRSARFGFCRIIKDYYNKLMHTDWISAECKDKLNLAFQGIIEKQLINYIRHADKRDFYWESLYLQNLSIVGLEEEEILSVKCLFNKI